MPGVSLEGVPEWGIEPVPRDRRVLTGFDLAVLWGDLGIGLLVLVTGALLVPGLGFGAAMLAVVLGSVIGVGLLALGASAGADHGIPTMVLFRPTLGIRGSWFPTILNVAQLIGWTAVELWAISFVADIVSDEVFGFSARWLWLAIAAVVCTGLALWGPVGVTRVWMERFGAWVIVGISAAVTILVFASGDLAGAFTAPGIGGFPSFGIALDLVIVMPISWLPLVADYTRFASGSRPAFTGTLVGYLIANVWLYALGILLVLGAGATASPEGIAAGILALAGGSIAGALFLIGLLAGEADQAFADIYSGAVSLRNIWTRGSHRALVVWIAAIGTTLAGWLTMELYETFLFLLGSVFIPLFGILVADYFVIRKRRLDATALYERGGAYWYRNGIRWAASLPWLAGFAVYHWIAPSGPDWWTSFAADLFGQPLVTKWPWLSASLVSFVVAFLLMLPAARLSSGDDTKMSSRRTNGAK
jgi:nucleobase:cation symporter-1, NCS1 family